jgi:hypothetical protein
MANVHNYDAVWDAKQRWVANKVEQFLGGADTVDERLAFIHTIYGDLPIDRLLERITISMNEDDMIPVDEIDAML